MPSYPYTIAITYVFNLNVTDETFPSLWKQAAAAVPVFGTDSSAVFSNCRPVSVLNSFSKVFEIIVPHHLSYFFFKHTLKHSQHDFHKFSSTPSSLITYVNALSHSFNI
jgi:hypothetical protein